MTRLTQDNHLIAISDFGLGKDTLLLTSFTGKESISHLFQYEIDVLSENLDICPDDLIGKSGTVTIQNQQQRKFNGYISRFAFGEIKYDNLRAYKLTMVPWLWFLSKTNNHRIFQDKTVKDIVCQIFRDHGFSDFNFTATGGRVREYCVQHNESDFHFVSRLLEEDGIAYYFLHEENKHVLHLIDEKNAYQECAETNLEYSKGTLNHSHINQWEHRYLFRKGQWSLNDYNFKEPDKSLLRNTKTISHFANNGSYEHYEYPGYYEYGYRDEVVKMRQDAEELNRNSVEGQSNCCTFYAGGKFKLAKHATKAEKGHYIITDVFHDAKDTSYFTGDDTKSSYSNQFNCIPADIHYRPALKHQRPVMRGQQSAIVVGPAGEEIYVDEFGRIKVQFIWDREGEKNENSTCFIRVMQSWAGNKWGASFIPRIGHEVIVSFLDGDPDRPLVVGTVYNGKNKPPYDSKTQSGIKSRSTKGASASNFNEIRFDDKLGAEEVYMQAEKDRNHLVKNDETTNVGNNRTENVGNDETITIGNNRTESVGVDETITIGSNRTESVGSNESISIGNNRDEKVGSNETVSIGSNQTNTIGSNRTENVGGNETQTIAKLRTHNIGINDMLNVGAAQEITVGGFRMVNVGLYHSRNTGLNLVEKVGTKMEVTVGDEIVFKTGDSSLTMQSDGTIILKGKDIVVDAAGDMLLKAKKNITEKAKKILNN